MTPFDYRAAAAAAIVCLGASVPALASDKALSFDISSQPIADALVELARQAGVTLGMSSACSGRAEQVRGRLSVSAALDRLLARSNCGYVWVDAQTVQIIRRGSAEPAKQGGVEPSPPSVSRLDQVIVTAAKRDLSSFSFPGSVTVIGPTRLEDARSTDTRDLSLLASGVTVTNLGSGRDKILLRGLSDGAFTGRTQSTVGLYWNDVPITYNAPDPDLRLLDVQSIDVLRGPQGSLYGSGSIGGVIDIVPRRPDFDRISASLATTESATESGNPSGEVEGVLNLPFAQGRAALRLVAYAQADGGYIDDPRLGLKDVNYSSRWGQRAALSLRLAPGWSATLGSNVQFIDSAGTQYIDPKLPALERNTLVREPHDNDFEQVFLRVEGSANWGSIREITSFVHHEFASQYDASSALAAFDRPVLGTGTFLDDPVVGFLAEEVDYRSPGGGRSNWLAGLYAAGSNERERSNLTTAPVASTPYQERRRDRNTDLAVFGEWSYAMTPALKFTLGARAFSSRRTTSSTVLVDGAVRPFSGTVDMRDVAPKLALQYQVLDSAMIYALASEGYRPGGFNTSGSLGQVFSAQGGQQPTRTFLPDKLWNYEIGAKASIFSDRLSGQTAVYYDFWDKLQADQFLASGLPFTANVGDARIWGWEWELSGHPMDRLTLEASALFTAPDLNQADATFSGRSDFTLPGVPRRSMNVRMAYDLPLSRDMTLLFNADAQYVGRSYLFFGPSAPASMGDYFEAKLLVTLKTRAWRMTAFLDNPGDVRGDTFAFGNPFSLQNAQQSTPLRPRTVGFTLKRDF